MNIELDAKTTEYVKKNGGVVTVQPPRPAAG